MQLPARWLVLAVGSLIFTYADAAPKLDATADRAAGVLRVDAVHQDVPFDRATAAAVDGEIADLARWLGLSIDSTLSI